MMRLDSEYLSYWTLEWFVWSGLRQRTALSLHPAFYVLFFAFRVPSADMFPIGASGAILL